jgi:serine phosphatase RsbU (regulator of sigma subunit)
VPTRSKPAHSGRWGAISIRGKLALLAGIPVLGAVLLAFQVVLAAEEESRRAEALGSIESLSELSVMITGLVRDLQSERVELASALQTTPEKPPSGGSASLTPAFAETDRARAALTSFFRERDEARLPARLRSALGEARQHMDRLDELRGRAQRGGVALEELVSAYAEIDTALIRAMAGLSDLSGDGDLLRLMGSLVLLLDLEERVSQEHALLTSVFARREFPPGSFRKLVSLASEEDIYARALTTTADLTAQQQLAAALASPSARAAEELRKTAIETAEEELAVDPAAWSRAQTGKLAALLAVELDLTRRSREVTQQKLARMRRTTTFSTSLVAGILSFSLIVAWLLARGVTRRVERLRDASNSVAAGDLHARVTVDSADELGQLGAAFNDMVSEIGEARAALSEQLRMSRELEIAASIQRAMLPPTPQHAEFAFAGKMHPADEVGGDFYDVLTNGQSEALWITIGDVSGHGVGAGLVMLMAQAAFASHFLENSSAEPERVLRDVNSLLCENIAHRLRDDKYLTAQLLRHLGQGRFACVGAHEWPVVFRRQSGRCETIPAEGPWLGIYRELPEVPTSTIELAPGDVLCLYSDGITEAQNEAGELFDVERLARLIERELGGGTPLSDVPAAIFAEVERYSGRHADDWTLLLVQRSDAAA